MKTLYRLLLVTLAGVAAHTTNFDSAAPGTVPAGWTIAMTHAGAPPKWEVLKDTGAPSPPHVFAQVSKDGAEGRFPLAILNNPTVQDGDLSVKLKPVGGAGDRAGGLVWRYRDPDNYYLVRANALENNVVLYKVERGKRIPLAAKGGPPTAYGVRHPVPANQWSVLKVQFRGPLFSVYFNHRRLFQVQDTSFRGPGRVGLWTKADSVTYFDDFSIAGK